MREALAIPDLAIRFKYVRAWLTTWEQFAKCRPAYGEGVYEIVDKQTRRCRWYEADVLLPASSNCLALMVAQLYYNLSKDERNVPVHVGITPSYTQNSRFAAPAAHS